MKMSLSYSVKMTVEEYVERPILFSGDMVKAILEGRKTQTRRVVKVPRGKENGVVTSLNPDGMPILAWGGGAWNKPSLMEVMDCPYGKPGDRLWVKETQWRDGGYVHLSSRDNEGKVPAIFMRRDESRIDLEIVHIAVERVQAITEADALAEGMPFTTNNTGWQFQMAWRKLNKKAPARWDDNPWVWVITFKRLRP